MEKLIFDLVYKCKTNSQLKLSINPAKIYLSHEIRQRIFAHVIETRVWTRLKLLITRLKLSKSVVWSLMSPNNEYKEHPLLN